MQQTFGAVCALAILGLLLIGPLYMAIASSHDTRSPESLCVAEMGCDPVTMERAAPIEPNGRG
jgi:hypothetical protein